MIEYEREALCRCSVGTTSYAQLPMQTLRMHISLCISIHTSYAHLNYHRSSPRRLGAQQCLDLILVGWNRRIFKSFVHWFNARLIRFRLIIREQPEPCEVHRQCVCFARFRFSGRLFSVDRRRRFCKRISLKETDSSINSKFSPRYRLRTILVKKNYVVSPNCSTQLSVSFRLSKLFQVIQVKVKVKVVKLFRICSNLF